MPHSFSACSGRWTPRADTARRACLALAVVVLGGCGGTAAGGAAWRSSHPDPAGITFEETGPGVCAFAAQYPDEAPAALDFQGSVYVQQSREVAPAVPPGRVVGRSAGWIVTVDGSRVDIDTGTALFLHRLAGAC